MKFRLLQQMVSDRASKVKEIAAYEGARDDGGSEILLNNLLKFKTRLIEKHDLRPSEYQKLGELEVGEPKEFSDVIERYKQDLVKQIKL